MLILLVPYFNGRTKTGKWKSENNDTYKICLYSLAIYGNINLSWIQIVLWAGDLLLDIFAVTKVGGQSFLDIFN